MLSLLVDIGQTNLTIDTHKKKKNENGLTLPLAMEWMGRGLILAVGRGLTLNCVAWDSAAFCAAGFVGFRSSSFLMSLYSKTTNQLNTLSSHDIGSTVFYSHFVQ